MTRRDQALRCALLGASLYLAGSVVAGCASLPSDGADYEVDGTHGSAAGPTARADDGGASSEQSERQDASPVDTDTSGGDASAPGFTPDAASDGGAAPSNGLRAFYALDGNADDAAPTPANGTVHGAVPATDRFGRADHAMRFDGTSAYVDAPDTNLPVGARPRTLSAWFNTSTTAPDWQTIANWGTETKDGRFCLTVRGRNPSGPRGLLYFSGEFVELAGKVVADGKWHNATVTFDGSRVTLYVDGAYANSAMLPLNTALATFVIGRHVLRGTEFFQGTLDDVRIYDRVLTATEVKALFTAPP